MNVFLFVILSFINCKALKISIFYEKSMPENINNFYSNYLESLVSKYNKIFIQEQIRIQVDDIVPFNKYVNQPRYSELVNLAGTDNLKDRANELRKLAQNHVMLGVSTTTDDTDADEYNYYSPCNSIYIFNLNSTYNQEKELTKILSNALIDLLSKIFIMDIPDFTQEVGEDDIKFFKDRIGRSEIVKTFSDCFDEKDEIEEKNDENDFSRIEGLTRLYDQLKNKDNTNNEPKNNPQNKNEHELEDTIKELSSKISTLFDIINVNKQKYNTFLGEGIESKWPSSLMNKSLQKKEENKTESNNPFINNKLDYGYKKRFGG